VLGYGGWDDAFTSAIKEIARDNETLPDILWAFHSDDPLKICSKYASLLDTLSSLPQGRCSLYTGVDFDALMLKTLAKALGTLPAESADIFFERVDLLQRKVVELPSAPELQWGSSSSLGPFVQALKQFDRKSPARAALCLSEYLLPLLEQQPIIAAAQVKTYEWVRPVIQLAWHLLESQETSGCSHLSMQLNQLINAESSVQKDSFDGCALRVCSYSICSVLAVLSGGEWTRSDQVNHTQPSDAWAGAAVHAATRALRNDTRAAWCYITSRLSDGRDHLAHFREAYPLEGRGAPDDSGAD
jgi:hypothetical protein